MTYNPISPGHYKDDRKYETIEVIEDWKLNFNLGNVIKYIGRSGRKPGENPIEGLKKAAFYLNREIETLEQLQAKKVNQSNDWVTANSYEDILCFTGFNYSSDDEFPKYTNKATTDYIGQAEWDNLCDI
jgi:hypothetical protein